jgi:hypothetical protein
MGRYGGDLRKQLEFHLGLYVRYDGSFWTWTFNQQNAIETWWFT